MEAMAMYENYLAHYGILGMKWGIRRFQPYSVRGRKSGKGGREIGEAKKASGPSHDDLVKSTNAKEVYENRDKLNDRELRERVNRIQTEQQLKQLVDASEKKGKSVVRKILDGLGAATISFATKEIFKYGKDKIYPKVSSTAGEILSPMVSNIAGSIPIEDAVEAAKWMFTPMSELNVWPS